MTALGVAVLVVHLQPAPKDDWGVDLASTISADSAIDTEVFDLLDGDRDGLLSIDELGLAGSTLYTAAHATTALSLALSSVRPSSSQSLSLITL